MYSVTAAAQTAILTAIVVVGKGAPTRGAVAVGQCDPGAVLDAGRHRRRAAVMGLAMSAAAKSQDQILPMLVISVMLSHRVLRRDDSGHRPTWSRSAVLGCSRPAGGSPPRPPPPICAPSPPCADQRDAVVAFGRWWLLDMAMLIALGVVLAGFVRWRLRLRTR